MRELVRTAMQTPEGEQVKPRDIHEAVDQLVNGKRILLFKDERGYNIRGDVPSLIDQLQAAVARGGNGNGGGKLGSRPPIAVGITSLLIEIATACADAVKARHNDHLQDISGNLRRIAADRANLPPTDEDLNKWIDRMAGWANKARAALGIEPRYPRGLRGVSCPTCGADSAPTTDDDGKPARMPALQFEWSQPVETADDELPEDRKVRAVVCQMCEATWWPGPQFYDLQAQIERTVRINTSEETLAR